MSQAASSSSSAEYAGRSAFDGKVVGVPNSVRRTLIYADSIGLDAGASQSAVHVFRMNSLFDPDYTGVGHQPRYFDQLAAMFNRYRVDSIDVEINWTSPATALGALCTLNGANTLNGNAPLDALELPFTSSPLIVNTTGPLTQRFKVNLAAVNGVSKKHYEEDDRFQATIGTNPAEAMGLSVAISSPDNATVGTIAYATVRIAFHCVMFDRISVASS